MKSFAQTWRDALDSAKPEAPADTGPCWDSDPGRRTPRETSLAWGRDSNGQAACWQFHIQVVEFPAWERAKPVSEPLGGVDV